MLADAGEFAGGEALITTSSQPRQVAALALRDGSRQAVLLANLGAESWSVRLEGVSGSIRVRTLSSIEVQLATRNPEGYRAAPPLGPRSPEPGPQLQLPPYAYARVVIVG